MKNDIDIIEFYAWLGIIGILIGIILFALWCVNEVKASDFKIGVTKSVINTGFVPINFVATTSRDVLIINTNATKILVNSKFCEVKTY